MASQLRGDHAQLGRLLDATADESGADAEAWHVQYLGNGKPLFVHIETGFRTFDKPRALRAEDAMALLREAAAARPVSNIATMPRESDWYEHRVRDGKKESLLFYQNAATGQVSWEDPYECTLQAASDAADRNQRIAKHRRAGAAGEASGDHPLEGLGVEEGSWDRLLSDAGKMVYWRNRATGKCTWEEPGKAHIRRAIREAQRAEEEYQREADEAASLLTLPTAEVSDREGSGRRVSFFRRVSVAFMKRGSGIGIASARRTSMWNSAASSEQASETISTVQSQFPTIDEGERESSVSGISFSGTLELPKEAPQEWLRGHDDADGEAERGAFI